MKSPRSYRPALRGLVFGLSAWGVHAVGMVWMHLSHPIDLARENFAATMQQAMVTTVVGNLAATCVALVGVGYSAIASHRGDWGIALVLAWITSLLGVLYESGHVVYATF